MHIQGKYTFEDVTQYYSLLIYIYTYKLHQLNYKFLYIRYTFLYQFVNRISS